MSEIGDMHKDIKREKQRKGELRRAAAKRQFPAARAYAAEHGMTFTQVDEAHYQLEFGGWLYNLYPGNLRVFSDKNRRGPFVKLAGDWTLLDVVDGVIKVLAKNKTAEVKHDTEI